MNTIRTKIIFFWLLLLTWSLLLYWHHVLIAWCLYWLLLLLRYTKPKVPQLSKRVGYVVGFGFVAFLVFVLIDSFYPLPSGIVTVGKFAGLPMLWFLMFYLARLDYNAFKTATGPGS